MRASATLLIGILALLLTACGIEPQLADKDKELAELKGPEPTLMDSTLNTQAQQAEDAGNFSQAAQIYKQLVDKSPDNATFQVSYAESLRRSGDYQASLRVTDEIIKKHPDNAGALENKALCLMATGDFDESASVFGQVMKIDPKRWRTLNGSGILFAMKGRYDAAVSYFQAALNVSTDNPSVLNNAALTYAIDRQFERSYEAFGRAKRHISPESADMKHLDMNLALVYAVDGKLDDAERTAAPYLSKAALYNNMGFYSYLAKNNDMAKGYLNMALTQNPVYYERAWKNLGALTGDASATSGETQAMPFTPSGQTMPSGALPEPSAPAAAVAVPLSDIPQSNPFRLADTSPSSDAMTMSPPASPAPSQPPVILSTTTSSSSTPVLTSRPAQTQSRVIPSTTTANNPDIVLAPKLKVPTSNGDWDAQDNGATPMALPASAAPLLQAPAQTSITPAAAPPLPAGVATN